MAYDIGQGISDALGSVAEGMLTRKERKEERESLQAQAEMIGEYKYNEYQDLLSKDDPKAKDAERDFLKWQDLTNEDQATKKIEGAILEYEKTEVRKSRRLQNTLAELQTNLARETNPFKIKTIQNQAETQALALEEAKLKSEERKNLKDFYGGLHEAVNKPVDQEIPEFGLKQEKAGSNLFGSLLNDGYLNQGSSQTEFVAPENRREWLQEKKRTSDDILIAYGLKQPPASAASTSVEQEGVDNLYSKVPVGPEAEFYGDSPYVPSSVSRPPSTSEMAERAQEYLAMKAPGLSPEGQSAANTMIQSRFPRAIPGAPVTYDGKETGKMLVGTTLASVPRTGSGSMPNLGPNQRISGTSTKWNEEKGRYETTYNTERFVPSEQPEYVPMAESMAAEDDALTYKKSLTPGAGEAKEFRQMAADGKTAQDMIDRVFDIANQYKGLSGETRLRTIELKAKGEISSLLLMLRGKLRLAVIGPGAVSIYEQEILSEVAANPSDLLQWSPASIKKLEVLRRVVGRGIKNKGEQLGLWDYDPELESDSELSKNEKRKPMTVKEAKKLDDLYEKNLKKLNLETEKGTQDSGNIPQTSRDGTPMKFESLDQAKQQGTPGSWVYVYNQTTQAFEPYKIPSK